MTETNSEIFDRVIDAFNRRGLEAAVEYFDDDVEVYDPDLPEGMRILGRQAVLDTFGQILAAFETMKVADYESISVGDRVIGLIHIAGYGEGRRGGMGFEQRDAHVMTFKDGKIVYWRLYLDQAEALADAGLDPGLAYARRPDGSPNS